MNPYGKTLLQLEMTKLTVLLIKYTKHAKHLNKQNKKLRIEKLQLNKEIQKLNDNIEILENKHCNGYFYEDEDDIGYNSLNIRKSNSVR